MFVCMEAIGNVKEPRDFFYHYHLQLQAIKSLWQAVGRQVDAKNIWGELDQDKNLILEFGTVGNWLGLQAPRLEQATLLLKKLTAISTADATYMNSVIK